MKSSHCDRPKRFDHFSKNISKTRPTMDSISNQNHCEFFFSAFIHLHSIYFESKWDSTRNRRSNKLEQKPVISSIEKKKKNLQKIRRHSPFLLIYYLDLDEHNSITTLFAEERQPTDFEIGWKINKCSYFVLPRIFRLRSYFFFRGSAVLWNSIELYERAYTMGNNIVPRARRQSNRFNTS